MEQVTSQLCPRCQMAPVAEGSALCSVCSTQTETIASTGNASLNTHDDDKTVRVNAGLPTRLYLKAVQQEDQESVSAELALAQKDPVIPTTPIRKKSKLRILYGAVLVVLLLLLITEATSYNGTAVARQRAEQAKLQLDTQLWQIQGKGVPPAFLRTLLQQEQQIDSAPGILTTLDNPLVEAYYQRQVQQYRTLLARVPGIVSSATTQLQAQAQADVQNLQTALARTGTLGMGTLQLFAGHLSQEQLAFSTAHQLADYVAISSDARAAIAGLNQMVAAFQHLTTLAGAINTMKQAHLNVASVETAYQSDLQLFRAATEIRDFQSLSAQITVQDQQLVVASLRSFPYISIARLNEYQDQIQQLQTYGGNTREYLTRLSADQISAGAAQTTDEKLAFFQTIDTDIAALHDPLVRSQTRYLLRQFHKEVETWGVAHLYYDRYDGKKYRLDDGYASTGVGGQLDQDVKGAQTSADFENVLNEINNASFNLHMFEQDYADQTAYNRVHQSDLQIIAQYGLQKRQVLVVSLAEQVMRVYQDGKLVRAFVVTTGRQELPSLPGVWSVLARRSPVIFQSGEPRNSPYWFPDTPIQYAMLYHLGGYFIHDAPWRLAFGPGTQFPHADPIGTSAYNFDGSHGCINLATNDAAWVYTHTSWNTAIVIY